MSKDKCKHESVTAFVSERRAYRAYFDFTPEPVLVIREGTSDFVGSEVDYIQCDYCLDSFNVANDQIEWKHGP